MTPVARSSTADSNLCRRARRSPLGGLVALALVGAGCSGEIHGGSGGPGGGMNPPGVTPGSTGSGGPSGGPGSGGPSTSGPGNTPGGPTTPGGPIMMYPPLPGHTPLRRLTRTEYNNTVHDLLGVTGDFASDFGEDENASGFTANNGAPLTDGQVEKYELAAEGLADKAVANLGAIYTCAAGAPEMTCVTQFISTFGKRALRRPLTNDEVGRYVALYNAARMGTDVSTGISQLVSAFLQSPYFLYRIELGDPATATKDGVSLTPYEIATRLSYFLTESTPDDMLLAAADSGKLKTPEGIAAEAQRLLTSDAGRNALISFYEQWLGVDDLLTVEKDPMVYPVYTPEVRTAMHDEIDEFVDQVTRLGDGKLATLLTSRTTYMRGPLYPIYGMGMATAAGGSILHKIDLPPTQRAGVLTLAGVMTEYGHADQSSPVGRGKLISERLLCVVPPDPPPGVAANIPAPDPNISTRVRFERHRTDPQCATCHALMDPLGVPFEIYDGVGRYRTTDGNKPVDPTSMLMGTKTSDGPIKDAIDLVTKLSTAPETSACFSKQVFRFAFGRDEQPFDNQLITDILGALTKTGRIPDLMVALTTEPGFRTRIPVDLR